MKSYRDTITTESEAIHLKPDCAEAYYQRGLAYSRNAEIELAIEDYTQAIACKPDYAEAYYHRGGAWLRLGEHEKAEADLTTARNLGCDAIIAIDKILQDYARAWKTLGNT